VKPGQIVGEGKANLSVSSSNLQGIPKEASIDGETERDGLVKQQPQAHVAAAQVADTRLCARIAR
jgi:hypothetical protein